uniref:Uncharacterized protein n=1 Tax=Rhizophora mucronata TaxID=61149 RepID=A0A2P2Q0X4_RHIMU
MKKRYLKLFCKLFESAYTFCCLEYSLGPFDLLSFPLGGA